MSHAFACVGGGTDSRIGREQHTEEWKMTQVKTPMIAIDRIEIEEGFNARKTMDKAKLERMASREHALRGPANCPAPPKSWS